jgi:hypothetical protein
MDGEPNHSPKLFSEVVYKWLENALDMGITERDFWEMTIAEVNRAIASRKRVLKVEAQEKASYDYILADSIGRSIARIYSSSNTLPDIGTVYPTLFDSKELEEKRAAKKAELSALRFRQFADSYNRRFKEGKKINE